MLDVDNNSVVDFNIFFTRYTFTSFSSNSTTNTFGSGPVYLYYGMSNYQYNRLCRMSPYGSNAFAGPGFYVAGLEHGSSIGVVDPIGIGQWSITSPGIVGGRSYTNFRKWWRTVHPTYTTSGSNANIFGPYDRGAWPDRTRFAGLQFDIGGSTHYGWVRLGMDSLSNTVTIYDYAYSIHSNTSIQAGEGAVSIDFINEVEASMQMWQSVLMINAGDNFKLDIVDMLGQNVRIYQLPSGDHQIDLEILSPGIYVGRMEVNGRVYSKKIYIR